MSEHAFVVMGFFIGIYACKTWFYIDSYKDDYWLVENARMHSPDSWFAWHVAALKRWDVGSHKEAIIFWVMAKMISPNEFKILFNLAAALAMCQNQKEAAEHLVLAEKNIPAGQEKQCQELIDRFKQKGEVTILV